MDIATDSVPTSSQARAAAAAPRTAAPDVPRRLDELLALDAAALERLYGQATVPAIPDLSGDLRGRMLALVDAPAALTRLGHYLGSRAWFPWRGKSFTHDSASAGGGINRVLRDRFRFFEFDTFVGPSRAGSFDAVQLDYDSPRNPAFIRWVKDEVRELRPGLFLGQAWLALPGRRERLALYFGLEKR
jgi:hypothetical protein